MRLTFNVLAFICSVFVDLFLCGNGLMFGKHRF